MITVKNKRLIVLLNLNVLIVYAVACILSLAVIGTCVFYRLNRKKEAALHRIEIIELREQSRVQLLRQYGEFRSRIFNSSSLTPHEKMKVLYVVDN